MEDAGPSPYIGKHLPCWSAFPAKLLNFFQLQRCCWAWPLTSLWKEATFFLGIISNILSKSGWCKLYEWRWSLHHPLLSALIWKEKKNYQASFSSSALLTTHVVSVVGVLLHWKIMFIFRYIMEASHWYLTNRLDINKSIFILKRQHFGPLCK